MICKIFGKKPTCLQLFVILGLYLFTSVAFWEKFIWLSGSMNYLWTVTLMLVVMYYFYNILINNNKLNKVNIAILLIVSFFARMVT